MENDLIHSEKEADYYDSLAGEAEEEMNEYYCSAESYQLEVDQIQDQIDALQDKIEGLENV